MTADLPFWSTGIDVAQTPSAARLYDYFLGGSHNFAVDRAAADPVIAAVPTLVPAARANRSFLRRVVTSAVQAGVRQFLDLGSGIPTAGNVHEIARRHEPSARVVYIDNDPVAVAHTRLLLADEPGVTVDEFDIRRMDALLATVAGRIDFDQPVAVLAISVLHFMPGDLTAVMTSIREKCAPTSLLAISHAADDDTQPVEQMQAIAGLYAQTPTSVHLRNPAEIISLFDGFELLAPHVEDDVAHQPRLVTVDQWRPEDPGPHIPGFLAGVGRKPPAPRTHHHNGGSAGGWYARRYRDGMTLATS